MASVPGNLKPGSVFAGRYKIKRLLGEGDRKRTYLAEDIDFERQVALSLIKASAAAADPKGMRREVRILARAGANENVVTIHDAGTSNGTDYLVFAYMTGGTLGEFLAKRAELDKPLSAEEFMRLGRRLARALEHIHGLGLIHRDITPANIWMDKRQMAHLGDFDSAVSMDDASGEAAALPATTEAYAPPEQLAGRPVDQRSDLYSLGAVLYEALTGAPPERPRQGSIVRALAEARPDLPPNLRKTLGSLLAESPDERPVSAGQVLAALLLPRQGPAGADHAETWADSLPFPLASILWQYHGETDEGAKVALLLKFFEALAQFAGTVLLSAVLADRELFDAHRAEWFGDGPKGLRLEYASFGTWVTLVRRLTKYLRALSKNDDGAERLRCLFHTRNLALAEVLSSPKFASVLLKATDRRNIWAGHGGIAGEEVQRERLSEIRTLLVETQDVLDSAFEPWTLIKPGRMTLEGEIFDLTATVLKGPNSAFQRKQVRLTEPLDTSRLYLLNDGESQALGLAPFIRVLTGEKGNPAFYFYSRMEGPEARWVSYHHHREPELQCPDRELTELLAMVGSPVA